MQARRVVETRAARSQTDLSGRLEPRWGGVRDQGDLEEGVLTARKPKPNKRLAGFWRPGFCFAHPPRTIATWTASLLKQHRGSLFCTPAQTVPTGENSFREPRGRARRPRGSKGCWSRSIGLEAVQGFLKSMPQSHGAARGGDSRGKRSPSSRPTSPKAGPAASRSAARKAPKTPAGSRKQPRRAQPVREERLPPATANAAPPLEAHARASVPPDLHAASKPAALPETLGGATPPQTAVATASSRRDLSAGNGGDSRGPSQILTEVCDRHWLRARWSVTRESVRRAEARLATEWHRAVPVLRLLEVREDEAHSNAERFVREAQIDSETHTWYLPVPSGGTSYRVHIGYRGSAGTFFALAKSNICHFPRQDREGAVERLPGGAGEISDDASPARPLGFSALKHFGPQATRQRQSGAFRLQLGIEVSIHGQTSPGSVVTVQQDPLDVREDGSFTYRVGQPEGRQVLAIAAVDPQGKRRQVVVLGLERNTKELEQQSLEEGEHDTPE